MNRQFIGFVLCWFVWDCNHYYLGYYNEQLVEE